MASVVLGLVIYEVVPHFFGGPGERLAGLLVLFPYSLWLPVLSDLRCKAEGKRPSLWSLTPTPLQIQHHPCSGHWGHHHHPRHIHGPSALIST